uniref:Reverse transcriptase domain-containing protein n=1 Tax=Oreochromis aureus TaxID=47969 RepID=A0AAZ1XD42_OREAU
MKLSLAYADDVTVLIRNQNELSSVMEILHQYELASGAKLNQDKTEGVWLGHQTRQPKMTISLCREIKILGIWIDNTDSSLLNWNKKENEIRMEIMKWENKDTNYKTRINIVKSHIISKLLYLATILPPPRKTVMKISKMCIKFIWGSNREVTKRKFMYKSRKHGGLGAPDLEIVLRIPFIKNTHSAISRGAPWVRGKEELWNKKRGRARAGVPYHRLMYGDLSSQWEHYSLNILQDNTKNIYKKINEIKSEGMIQYNGRKWLLSLLFQTSVLYIKGHHLWGETPTGFKSGTLHHLTLRTEEASRMRGETSSSNLKQLNMVCLKKKWVKTKGDSFG